jgi:5-methylcytosine-specific restriction endonuclease McrA
MPIRPEYRHFYRTPEWRAARAAVRQRAGDDCERCGSHNGDVEIRQRITAGALLVEKEVLIQCGAAHRNNVPGDDRLENLAWWCRGCHLANDENHHRYTRSARKDGARPLLAIAEARL